MIRLVNEDDKEFLEKLLKRSVAEHKKEEEIVSAIVNNVKENGDEVIFEYTKRFDGFEVNENNIKVSEEEFQVALNNLDKELIETISLASDRIRKFHMKQKRTSWFDAGEFGEILGQIITPVHSAGVYVPGGKAAYPSSVLMNVIPAKVAGVERIIITTPADKNGRIQDSVLVAAKIAGANEIYKIGGSQAIAAMAYGCKSIEKTDKIVGPGNIYVALAKKMVFGQVSIDSVAGPSEIMIIADDSSNPAFVAADLLSQAEHDELASAILLTTSKDLAEKVQKEIKLQTNTSPRLTIIKQSLNNNGAIILTQSMQSAIEIVNRFAPEHLEICTKNPLDILPKIRNAGAIFLGNYSPEPIGDYMAGTNHILPTDGTAKFFSPLSVDDFMKKSSLISFSKEAFDKLANHTIRFAENEGLFAHANAVRVRQNS